MLPWAVWQLNDLPGVDGTHSPHYIVFGRDPIGLGDMPSLHAPRASASAEEWYDHMSKLRISVQEHIRKLYSQRMESFAKKHKIVEFQIGDRVWLKKLPHEGNKLHPLWKGPFEIMGRVGMSNPY